MESHWSLPSRSTGEMTLATSGDNLGRGHVSHRGPGKPAVLECGQWWWQGGMDELERLLGGLAAAV